jgi:hypothetical protein
MQQALRWFDARASRVFIQGSRRGATGGMRVTQEPIDVDRSRKVTFHRIARKPAPMLVPDRLTVRMTVKIREAVVSTLQIYDLDGSLMIEGE